MAAGSTARQRSEPAPTSSSTWRPSGSPRGSGRVACRSACPAISDQTRPTRSSLPRPSRRATSHILGRPRVRLHASSTASVIGFAVSLADVAPDGPSRLVAKGMLNATRRDSLTEPEPLEPGEVYELPIDLDCTAGASSAGTGSGSASPAPTGRTCGRRREPAVNRVYRGAGRPSRIVLPVVPAAASATAPEFRPSPRRWNGMPSRIEPPGLGRHPRRPVPPGPRARLREPYRADQRHDGGDPRHTTLNSLVDADDPAGRARGRHTTRDPQAERAHRSDVVRSHSGHGDAFPRRRSTWPSPSTGCCTISPPVDRLRATSAAVNGTGDPAGARSRPARAGCG